MIVKTDVSHSKHCVFGVKLHQGGICAMGICILKAGELQRASA